MAHESDKLPGQNSSANADDRLIADRVQELTWALVDEQINDDEVKLLDTLLISDDKARDTYIGCVQLHVGLLSHFGAPPESAGSKVGGKAPVLGFLNTDLPPLSFQSPSAEEATQ